MDDDDFTAIVPCGPCTACCRAPWRVPLSAEEIARFPDATYCERNNVYELPLQANGDCSRFIAGRCSIYPDRPRACRQHDCRLTPHGVKLLTPARRRAHHGDGA